MIGLIVARSRNNVIGNADGIPWNIKGEQTQFRELTTGNAVIMGRKTYEDIGHPLPKRLNIVVSNTKIFEGKYLVNARSLNEALSMVKGVDFYIAGGRRLYEEAVSLVDVMYVTEVDLDVAVDDTTVFFPTFNEDDFVKVSGETVKGDIPYMRTTYIRKSNIKLEWNDLKYCSDGVEHCNAKLPNDIGYVTLKRREAPGQVQYTIHYNILNVIRFGKATSGISGMCDLPEGIDTMDKAKAIAGTIFKNMLHTKINTVTDKLNTVKEVMSVCGLNERIE